VPDLHAFADRVRRTGRMGIDTEFMGEGRYRSLLCVVQIVVENPDDPEDEVQVEVLDALDESLDPTPIAEILADPEIEIVLHAARQDVALLRRTWSTTVTNIFDTQVAAGFTGRGAQMGYDPLLQDLVGVRLRKSASFTKWDQRPLTDEQLLYAREDVLHLLQLASRNRHSSRAQSRRSSFPSSACSAEASWRRCSTSSRAYRSCSSVSGR
jgi:ribonuclease D